MAVWGPQKWPHSSTHQDRPPRRQNAGDDPNPRQMECAAPISRPEPLSEEAASATLTAAGRTVTGFARQLGAPAPRRALKRWEAAGHITQ
jgi:hypothetical protein